MLFLIPNVAHTIADESASYSHSPATGSYELVGYFARAQNYGDVRLSVEPTGPIAFGRVPLRAGFNDLVLEIVGKDARSQGYSEGYLVGVDGFLIRRVP